MKAIKVFTQIIKRSLFMLAIVFPPAAASENYRVYIDADFTTSFEVADAIALGIRTAFDEVGFRSAARLSRS